MCPGTILSRALGESGFQWKLGIGAMEMPKRWFWGWTVDGVVKQAEKAMREARKAMRDAKKAKISKPKPEIKRCRKMGGFKIVYPDGRVSDERYETRAGATAMLTGYRSSQWESCP